MAHAETKAWFDRYSPTEIISAVYNFGFILPRLIWFLALIIIVWIGGLIAIIAIYGKDWTSWQIVIWLLFALPAGILLASWLALISYFIALFGLLSEIAEKSLHWVRRVADDAYHTEQAIPLPNTSELLEFFIKHYLIGQIKSILKKKLGLLAVVPSAMTTAILYQTSRKADERFVVAPRGTDKTQHFYQKLSATAQSAERNINRFLWRIYQIAVIPNLIFLLLAVIVYIVGLWFLAKLF